MQQYSNSLFRQFPNSVSGNAAIGVSVNVYELGTTNHVTLYADDDLGGATLPNPLTTNDIGFYSFYAPDGKYTLHFGSSQFPDLNIQLIDALSLVNEFNTAQAATGFILIDNGFSAGYTVTQRNEALLFDGVYYVWNGSLNKSVPPASSPATTGGIGKGAWQAVLDNALRQELLDGTAVIAGQTAQSIADLRGDLAALDGIKALQQVEGAVQTTLGYHTNSGVGSYQYVWNPARSWLDHNGGTVLSSQAMAAYDGTTATLPAFLNFTPTAGSGCWEIILTGDTISPEMFGELPSLVTPISFIKAIKSCKIGQKFFANYENALLTGNLNVAREDFIGESITVNGNINCNGFLINIRIASKKLYIDTLTNTASSSNSLQLSDCENSEIFINVLNGSLQPLRLYSNRGSGFYNNDITVKRVTGNGSAGDAACVLATVEGGGFLNENTIKVGFMTGYRGVYFKKGSGQTARFDGNKLVYPMIEVISYRGLEFEYCNFCSVLYPRFEGSGTPSDSWIFENTDCIQMLYAVAHPTYKNLIKLNGEKARYLGPLLADQGDNSIGSRIALFEQYKGVTPSEDFFRAFEMSNSSPVGTISCRSAVGQEAFKNYLHYIKTARYGVVPAGELAPYGFEEFSAAQTGDRPLLASTSIVQIRLDSTTPTSLIMSVLKEVEGKEITLWIANNQFSKLVIKGSDGVVDLPEGTFDAEGVWRLFYRYSKWRAYYIGNNIKL